MGGISLPPWYLFALVNLALGSAGSVVGLMANSKRVLCQGGPSSAPIPVVSPCPSHASTGGPPTLAGSFGSASCGVTASLLWVLVDAEFCLCPLRLDSLVTLVLGKVNDQILLPLRPDSLGIPSLCWIPRLGSLTWGSEPSQ